MAEYFTAKTYEGMKWVSEPFKVENKMYVTVGETCGKCCGKGRIFAFGHIDNGICYDCGGSGKFRKDVRLYTAKEMESMARATARRLQKKQDELKAKSAERFAIWKANHAFNEQGITYCVYGDDTYAIKDYLKECGCKYDNLLKWHSATVIDLPDGYSTFEVSFDEICSWNLTDAVEKESAATLIDRRFKEAMGPSKSEYFGTVGERLRNITARYDSVRGFSGQFGWTNIYTFYVGDDCLVWMTAKDIQLEKGAIVDLTATVKCHEEFRGVKTTQISRAIVKEIK